MEFQQLSDEVVETSYHHKYIIKKYLDHIKNNKVLDAGCWTGSIEKEIVEQGIHTELIGIDENKNALDVAARNFSEFKFIQCELIKPTDEFICNYKSYFDTVIFLDVIEHLSKDSEVNVIKFFNKILKPDGVIIISTMSDHILNFIDPAWFFGHRHYKLKNVNNILENSGFQTIEALKIGNLYWDVDLLLFYIYKHILRKKYQTSDAMCERIMRGFNAPRIATRIYLLAKKIDSGDNAG